MNTLFQKHKRRQILLTVAFLALSIYAWHYYYRLPFGDVSPFEAVPAQAAVVVDFPYLPDITQLDTSTSLQDIRALTDTYPVESLVTDIQHLQHIMPSVVERPLTAALLVNGRRQLDWSLIVEVDTGAVLVEELQKNFGDFEVAVNNYKNHRVYDFKKRGEVSFSVAHYRNLLLYGRYALLVEEAIQQLIAAHSNITKDRSFRYAYQMAAAVSPVNIYLQLPQLHQLLTPYLRPVGQTALQNGAQLAHWVNIGIDYKPASDLDNTPARLCLSGGWAVPKLNSFLNAFGKEDVIYNETIQDILPDNTVLLNWFGTADFRQLYWQLNRKEKELFSTYFKDWIGGELARVVTEPFGGKEQSDQFAVFRIEDHALAAQQLRALEENVGIQKIYDYQMFRITQLLAEDLLLPVWGASMNDIQHPFYTLIEDYIVLSNSRAALEVWIDKYIAGQTMANEIDFLELVTQLDSETTGFMTIQVTKLQQLLLSYVKHPLRPALEANWQAFKKVPYIALNARIADGELALKGAATINEPRSKRTGIAWKMPLRHPAAGAPMIVRNESEQAYQILVQDTAHYLYLLNSGGGIIWEKQLPDSIISTIHAIDFYGNGETQYLFNTPNQIFLVDQAGKSVGAFPLHLQAAATTGVSVVDFDRNKEHHFFVPCENGNIYGFDKTGRPLMGWNPRRDVGIIHQPLQHFQRNGKDFIVAFNDKQKVLAFKRDGAYRFQSKTFTGQFQDAPHWQVKGSSPRVVLTSTDGSAYVTNLTGESFKMHLAVGDNQKVDFAFCDLVGDSRNDYIVLSGQHLAAYYYHDAQFSQHFSTQLPHIQQDVFPVYLPRQTKAQIGTLSTDKKLVSLINADGQLYPDFPLPGTSAFRIVDLFDTAGRVLVVANDASVYAYQLP